ncbi:hypothetical protein B0H14DRAFT_3136050 [Mycena olivaceomarginata]|nr:hypothetical protein B0H14DRAFT_3136050 [Mycena olivaceomarginata]
MAESDCTRCQIGMHRVGEEWSAEAKWACRMGGRGWGAEAKGYSAGVKFPLLEQLEIHIPQVGFILPVTQQLTTIPVHPSIYVVALEQLHDGATFSDIRKKNRELVDAKAYPGFPADFASSPYRWLLVSNDSRSLYRQYNRMKGVSVTTAPEINVDDWLDPKSENFNPTLADAIFHYSNRGERFEVAIANADMNRAAWTYGHQSQILLDGTFGVCDSRLLLFIVMTVDENKKGIPVAFLLFSAPAGNKQSSSGYDTAILTKLLRKWSESLNRCAHRHGHPGVAFKPMSAITDTDLKERGALIAIWSDIWLLICGFHLRQSWRNHRNKLLKGKDTVYQDLKNRMICLERALTATQTIEAARSLLEADAKHCANLTRTRLAHVEYLDTYWTTDNLWPSWSDYGRTVLASMLGIAVEGVIPTTNHLESFNGVLKGTHCDAGERERNMISEQASRIAALIRDILQEDSAFHKDSSAEADEEDLEDEDDNESVATDASSDSDSEDDSDDDLEPEFRATQNIAALGEQAVARTVFELEDMASRLADLGAYLDHRVTGLSPEESAKVDKGYGQLTEFISKLQRVRELPPPSSVRPPPTLPATPLPPSTANAPSTTSARTPFNPKKRKHLLPPSPEKMQKRHQSYNVH